MARILYFGRLSEAAGRGEAVVDLPADVADTAALRDWLGAGNPALAQSLQDPRVRMAINQVVAIEPSPVGAGDEIAFLPPVSGG